MADAIGCAVPNQNTPHDYYNIEQTLKSMLAKGGKVEACGTCMDARDLRNFQLTRQTGGRRLPTGLPTRRVVDDSLSGLVQGVEGSNMAELSQWTVGADKVFTFRKEMPCLRHSSGRQATPYDCG